MTETERLRVGVVPPAGAQPAWARELIDEIGRIYGAAGIDDADVVLVLGDGHGVGASPAEVWRIELDDVARNALLLSNGELIASVTAMPDPISKTRGDDRLGRRAASMVLHELERRARRAPRPPVQRPRPVPGAARRSRVRTAVAWLKQQWRSRYTSGQWFIAYARGDGATIDTRKFRTVMPPDDRLWADPFVVVEGGRTWIFVEEMEFATARGVISVIELRDDGSWSPAVRVLERPFHLSYPCVVRWNGGFYMMPESQESRQIELYRATDFPFAWEPHAVLMRDVDRVDATLFEHDGRWWLYYATISGDAAGYDRLWLQHAPAPVGPWTPHPMNPLLCDVVGGRPGGKPFVHEGRLIRAGQIGAPWYGHSIHLREIVTLTTERWEEREIGRIKAGWLRGTVGTHTLNADGGVTVIDALRRRVRFR